MASEGAAGGPGTRTGADLVVYAIELDSGIHRLCCRIRFRNSSFMLPNSVPEFIVYAIKFGSGIHRLCHPLRRRGPRRRPALRASRGRVSDGALVGAPAGGR